MNFSRDRIAPRAKTATVIGLAVVALAACGNDTDGSATATTAASTTTTASATTSTAAAATSSDEAAASPTTSAPAGAPGWSVKVFEHAGRTAIAAVPGSTLVAIEEDGDGSWEVDVASADGTEHHIELSPDGDSILAGPTVHVADDADRAEMRTRVEEAQVDFTAATGTILGEVPGGRITELTLEVEKGGTFVWEADVIAGNGARHEVTVDAVNGRLLQNSIR